MIETIASLMRIRVTDIASGKEGVLRKDGPSATHAVRTAGTPSLLVVVLAVVALVLVGCRQKMVETPRYQAYEENDYFEDSLAMRPLVDGVVPRSRRPVDVATNPYYREGEYVGGGPQGGTYEQNLTDQFPFRVTETVLARGQQQFNVYCSPCHSRLGDGRGMVVRRGLRSPPSFHTDRLRNAPAGHFYNVITNGFGAMYSYASRITPEDRWAIVAYIRALQLSQHATLDDVPQDKLNELQVVQP